MSAEAKTSPSIKHMEVRRYPFVVPGEAGEGLEALEAKSFVLRKVDYHPSGSIVLDIELDEEGNEAEKYENKLDEQGRIVEHLHYMSGELSERITIKYNEAGKITEEARHYEEGDPSLTIYVYDAQNRLLEKRIESSPGEVEHCDRYTYHAEGKENVETHEEFGYDMAPIRVIRHVYEIKDGEPVLAETHSENKETGKKYRTVHHDARTHEDNVSAVVYDSDERVAEVLREFYDEHGRQTRVTQKTRTPASDPVFEYEYDERGNVILQRQLIGGKPWAEVKRRYNEHNLQAWQATDHSNIGYFTDVFSYELY